jgi:membrane dipeptidase
MLIAYNRNNKAGGGCQDDDTGLTATGRAILDEMARVGMVLCCSHTGYRTSLEAMEYSSNPVIFSHSNPRALKDHERNIPDELIRACARTGGVVDINGIGIFLGDNDISTETVLRHVDYVAQMVGAEHVGLGLDYVFDRSELDEYLRAHPEIFPPEKGYGDAMAIVEPERFPKIAEGLLKMGYTDGQVQGVLGENNLRVATKVWR